MKRLVVLFAAFAASAAFAADGTYEVRHLTPEVAMKAAQAALADCRKRGFQVAVAVTDRGGVPVALVRDRLAGPHTVETASNKAFTATSFRLDTLELAKQTQPGQASSGIRHLPRVVAVGGGRMIEAGGAMVGGIGVSGAPGGEADDACARVGIEAVRADVEF